METASIAHEVNDLYGYQAMLDWLHAEFDYEKSTANRLLAVHRNLIVTPNVGSNALSRISISAAYLLAEDSFPPKVRQKFIEKAKAGEPVTHKEVKEALAKAKKPEPAKARPAPAPDPEPTDAEIEEALAEEESPRPAAAEPAGEEAPAVKLSEDVARDADESPWAAFVERGEEFVRRIRQIQREMREWLEYEGKHVRNRWAFHISGTGTVDALGHVAAEIADGMPVETCAERPGYWSARIAKAKRALRKGA